MDIRSLTGLVCPRCHHRVADSAAGFTCCSNDGFALVAPSVLADADGDPFLGLHVADRYAVLGKIGRGSTGTVYRAFDMRDERVVALKILRTDWTPCPRVRERIEYEARVLSTLRSLHTVKLIDVGAVQLVTDDEFASPCPAFFLAMEMLEGESLGRRIERAGRLSVFESIRWASDALRSLVEVHEAGIVHRDITPNNVLITRSNEGVEVGKLVDFGLAVFVGEVFREGGEGVPVGTPRYMSPEQARGEVLDARSDLYSVGLILYQMLTGRPAFTDGDAVRVLSRHMFEVPERVCAVAPDAGIPRWLSDVIATALAKRPEDRPRSAREFLERLGASGEGTGHRG